MYLYSLKERPNKTPTSTGACELEKYKRVKGRNKMKVFHSLVSLSQ
uniref:Uncharacterized protein n=1 Tax=Setaria italica TaxID=4555 RepID=K4APA4_SETIT